MVTKYDVFEAACSKGAAGPAELAKIIGGDKYKNIYRMVSELEKEGLLTRKGEKFSAGKTSRAALLRDIIRHCMDNGINYNLLLDRKLAAIISRGLEDGVLTQKNSGTGPRAFSGRVRVLDKYGLALLLSKKPLKAEVFYNALANNILVYFGFENTAIKKTGPDLSREIKKELSLYRKLRKKNQSGFREIMGDLEVSFIHHSLSLEGNPMTLPDTIKLLKNKIIPAGAKYPDVDEVKNYQAAMLKMLSDSISGQPLTMESVLEYHRIAMSHRPDVAGKIRDVEVFIKGNPDFSVSPAAGIKKALEALFGRYENFMKKRVKGIEDIMLFTSSFHNEFQHIHPFVDGNSRITRLTAFHILNSNGIPVFDLPFGLLDEYTTRTKGSKERDDKSFEQSVRKIVLFNLKKINGRLA